MKHVCLVTRFVFLLIIDLIALPSAEAAEEGAPVISNLSVSQKNNIQFEFVSTMDIKEVHIIADLGATVTGYAPQKILTFRPEQFGIRPDKLKGVASHVFSGRAQISGPRNFTIWVKDANGLKSNKLSGQITF